MSIHGLLNQLRMRKEKLKEAPEADAEASAELAAPLDESTLDDRAPLPPRARPVSIIVDLESSLGKDSGVTADQQSERALLRFDFAASSSSASCCAFDAP